MFTGNKIADFEILNKISDEEIENICSVNQYLKKLCDNDDFWNFRFHKFFYPFLLDIDVLKYKGDASWKEYYNWIRSSIINPYPYFISANALEYNREDILILLEKIRKIENVKEVLIYNKEETGKYYTRNGLKDGIKEGLYVTYYPNGNIKNKKEYKTGLPHGTWSTWFENGDLFMESKQKWIGIPLKVLDFDE